MIVGKKDEAYIAQTAEAIEPPMMMLFFCLESVHKLIY